ncbi:hypothetical protein V492_04670 [Pseudogymnoascus sp. VKM F-4246]|nr:hypothetical protein V492_04670 [Pseudogymnoascus sp. VKM F-4246]
MGAENRAVGPFAAARLGSILNEGLFGQASTECRRTVKGRSLQGRKAAYGHHHWLLVDVVVGRMGCVPLKVEAHDPCLIGHQWSE